MDINNVWRAVQETLPITGTCELILDYAFQPTLSEQLFCQISSWKSAWILQGTSSNMSRWPPEKPRQLARMKHGSPSRWKSGADL